MRRFLTLNVYPSSLMSFFSSVANGIGFDDNVESAKDAIMIHMSNCKVSLTVTICKVVKSYVEVNNANVEIINSYVWEL